jgi:GMP synthase-like glutamine amidotransferase
LVVVHEPGNPAGLVGSRLEHHGYELGELLVSRDLSSPSGEFDAGTPDEYDLIVAMGSTYSVYDTDTIGEWIGDELAFLAQAHATGVPVLGICFGAQALAACLGGAVVRAERPQIGWHPLTAEPQSGIPAGPWMQWHSDRIEPPPGASVLAQDSVGVQAFTIGRSLGVQFHPEVTPESIAVWIDSGGADELRAAGIDPEALVIETAQMQSDVTERTDRLVDWFVADVATRSVQPETLPATPLR